MSTRSGVTTIADSRVGYINQTPGWYGKLPCLGDFASRRLAADVIRRWDGWLQSVIAESRQQMGDQWLDAYLNSPIWHFVLQPGVCGDSGWSGVMAPSVDRANRHFPLSVMLQVAEADAERVDPLVIVRRLDALEDAAAQAVSLDRTVTDLEACLHQRYVHSNDDHRPSDVTLPGQELPDQHFSALSIGLLVGHLKRFLDTPRHGAVASSASLWWAAVPDEAGDFRVTRTPGLPDPDLYRRMITL